MLDVISVLLFVVMGRNTHDEGSALRGTLEVAAPFLLALGVGWAVANARGRNLATTGAGLAVWAVTVVGGMLLRHLLFDRGTALPFIIVAAVFLGLALVARRAVDQQVRRRR